jgi:uncharacterized protein YbjT (DUF2867 family)
MNLRTARMNREGSLEIMARVVVIGGSGHVGAYLLPALVECGYEVVNVSRGAARPYRLHPAWNTGSRRKAIWGSRPFEAQVVERATGRCQP